MPVSRRIRIAFPCTRCPALRTVPSRPGHRTLWHNELCQRNSCAGYLPDADKIRANPTLRPVSFLLDRTEIWHLHRRAAAGATFIGLFCAFVPDPDPDAACGDPGRGFPLQPAPCRGAGVDQQSPDVPPDVLFRLSPGGHGCSTCGWKPMPCPWISTGGSPIWDNIGVPMLFGALLCGWVAGVTGFVVVRVLWRFHVIRRWKERRARRRQRPRGQLRRAVPPPDSDAPPGTPESTPPALRAARTGTAMTRRSSASTREGRTSK